MYERAITQWLKQLEAGQPCQGKGWALLLLCQGYSSILPTSYQALALPTLSPFLLSEVESPAQGPGGHGRVWALPLPIPDSDAEQQAGSASAVAPPQAGGLLSTHRGAGRSSAGWRLLPSWPWLPGAAQHYRPWGLPLRQVNWTRAMGHLLPTLAKHKRN